jgi:hypothetical protein
VLEIHSKQKLSDSIIFFMYPYLLNNVDDD